VTVDLERLQRLLGGPELAGLRLRLRARFERGATRDEFTLSELASAERRALEGLLGRPITNADSMRVRLSDMDAARSHAGVASTLREALEALDGPIQDLKAIRTARDEAWSAMLDGVDHPRLKALIQDPTGGALLKRFAGHDPRIALELLEKVGRVAQRLPERGRPLAHLAAAELGNAHALDAGSPTATLVLRAFGLEQYAVERERSRDQWARLGITVNELAAPVLCLNLPTSGDSVASRVARVAASAGEPFHLTLRLLLREQPTLEVAGLRVFVCENPSIVSMAADRLGAACAPLICGNGMPGAAPQTLMRQLVAGGAQLVYHGDFDWAGIRIGNFMMREIGAAAWRFSTEDYLGACAGAVGILAMGDTIEADWDARLGGEMRNRRQEVHEEAVVERLIEDLDCRGTLAWGHSMTLTIEDPWK
jgi:uncharacterized protein (TIGR02679 family)